MAELATPRETYSFEENLRIMAGAPPGAERFPLRWFEHVLQVQCGWDGMAISLPYPDQSARSMGGYRGGRRPAVKARRPMFVILRREDLKDQANKAEGVNREAQVGDLEFDATVYLQTPWDPELIRSLFADEDARAAALRILARTAHPHAIVLDDEQGNITVKLLVLKDPPSRAVFEGLMNDLVALAAAMPAVVAVGRPVHITPGCTVLLRAMLAPTVGAVIVAAITIPHCFQIGGLPGACVDAPDCYGPVLAGLGGGGVVALLCWLIARRVLRGQWNSAALQKLSIAAAVPLSLETGIIVARLLW